MRHSPHVEDGFKTELQAIKNDLTNLRADVRNLATAALSEGKESADALRAGLNERAEAGARAVEKCIAQRPWMTLITIFGIGFIAAKIWRSR